MAESRSGGGVGGFFLRISADAVFWATVLFCDQIWGSADVFRDFRRRCFWGTCRAVVKRASAAFQNQCFVEAKRPSSLP